jgi:hypothetical protein
MAGNLGGLLEAKVEPRQRALPVDVCSKLMLPFLTTPGL